jgi:hypothetical protein
MLYVLLATGDLGHRAQGTEHRAETKKGGN